jgi:predicted Rossmann-fold nucleotide-binding protein
LATSGGGPGAMEATHLGAWFAERTDDELEDAIKMLGVAPLYKPQHEWLDAAFQVVEKYPVASEEKCMSLGIPTWLYGHEPPSCFALRIAKYFANSVREEGLLAIATGGVVFAPGSAGTIQEIFQDAAQNHYKSFGIASPMVFLGKEYWEIEKPVYPLITQLAAGLEYASLLSITDDVPDVVSRICHFVDQMIA